MEFQLNKTFQWKTRQHKFFTPAEMETRHLFMTLIMIWNHTMPVSARITQSGNWVHHTYSLGNFYTAEYLAEAIVHLSRELFKRTDMEPAWLVTLQKIEAYLASTGVKLLNE